MSPEWLISLAPEQGCSMTSPSCAAAAALFPFKANLSSSAGTNEVEKSQDLGHTMSEILIYLTAICSMSQKYYLLYSELLKYYLLLLHRATSSGLQTSLIGLIQ